jgi:hypothetical protein
MDLSMNFEYLPVIFSTICNNNCCEPQHHIFEWKTPCQHYKNLHAHHSWLLEGHTNIESRSMGHQRIRKFVLMSFSLVVTWAFTLGRLSAGISPLIDEATSQLQLDAEAAD